MHWVEDVVVSQGAGPASQVQGSQEATEAFKLELGQGPICILVSSHHLLWGAWIGGDWPGDYCRRRGRWCVRGEDK